MSIDLEEPDADESGVRGWPRLVFLLAATLAATLSSWTLIVHVPRFLPAREQEFPAFTFDIVILAFCGCAILMATSQILSDQLSVGQRRMAQGIGGAGILLVPISLALWLG